MTASLAYTTLLADPAWRFGDKLRHSAVKRSSVDHYDLTMTVDEICALRQLSHWVSFGQQTVQQTSATIAGFPISDVGFLCLWAPAAFVLDGSVQKVARAWGYEPKQIVPWIKGEVRVVPPRDGCHDLPEAALYLQMGMGRILRNCVEFLIVCTRGEYTKLVKHKGTHGLIVAPEDAVMLERREKSPTRGVEHSTKPQAQYELIEKVMPGPYLELFACEKRDGWTSVGSVFGQRMTPEGVEAYERGEAVLPDPGLEWDF